MAVSEAFMNGNTHFRMVSGVPLLIIRTGELSSFAEAQQEVSGYADGCDNES